MANTTNFGWETPDDTDLVKDGAAAIRTLGSAIDTSLVDLKGGTTGQILAKASNTDMDFTWASDASGIQATIFDAKGDLIAASAADTAARLAVGANGTVLTADSNEATGLKWATPAGGKILQVVSATTTTSTTIATTTYTDTTITATITPSATNSKILVLIQGAAYHYRGTNDSAIGARLMRDATALFTDGKISGLSAPTSSSVDMDVSIPIIYVDSPSTTSATTYKLQANLAATANSATSTWQENSTLSTITLLEIGA